MKYIYASIVLFVSLSGIEPAQFILTKKEIALVVSYLSKIKLHNQAVFEDIARCAHNPQQTFSASTLEYLEDNEMYSVADGERAVVQKALVLDAKNCWHIVDPTAQWDDDNLDEQPGWRFEK